MDKPLISDILKSVNKLGTRDERIAYLQEHDCTALRDILRIALDESINLDLPKGTPPYKKYDLEAEQADKFRPLRFEYPKFGNFVQAVTPKLNKFKREQLFIEMLQRSHPDEAELLCNAKDKNLSYKYVTKAIVKAAFPDLIRK